MRALLEISGSSQPKIIAESRAMLDVLNFVQRVAVSEARFILIEGENGTGKDLIAKTLHYQSDRKAEPFLAINCAAIPEALLESELFGYERGAFTDAREQKRGLFELANTGTLFLDEIGDMPTSLQAKLLRVLEDHSFRRLGGVRDIIVDLRIIAATNKNLVEAVREGYFRKDLYYRLNVIQLTVPPLRHRPEDILPLARFFIDEFNVRFKRRIQGFSEQAESVLLAHDWAGNVRELRNVIERAMILEDTEYVRPSSLRLGPGGDPSMPAGEDLASPIDGQGMSLVWQERRLIVHALDKTRGNQSQAARLLHITRDTLRYKMRKFHLDKNPTGAYRDLERKWRQR